MKIENAKLGGDANGTHLQGEVITNYKELVEAFGKPQFGPNDDMDGKVTCEWIMSADVDGEHTVATIYDWKTYSGTPMGEYEWHIGGLSKKAIALVKAQLSAVRNKSVKGIA